MTFPDGLVPAVPDSPFLFLLQSLCMLSLSHSSCSYFSPCPCCPCLTFTVPTSVVVHAVPVSFFLFLLQSLSMLSLSHSSFPTSVVVHAVPVSFFLFLLQSLFMLSLSHSYCSCFSRAAFSKGSSLFLSWFFKFSLGP